MWIESARGRKNSKGDVAPIPEYHIKVGCVDCVTHRAAFICVSNALAARSAALF